VWCGSGVLNVKIWKRMEPWSQKCFNFPVSLRHPVLLKVKFSCYKWLYMSILFWNNRNMTCYNDSPDLLFKANNLYVVWELFSVIFICECYRSFKLQFCHYILNRSDVFNIIW
jgi:hypothetical protein